jgi:hypothetical protein
MARFICPKCRGKGALLEGLSEHLWIEQWACERCGNVWIYEPRRIFRVIRPWGPFTGWQGTVQSVHTSVAEAFEAVDRVATEMVESGKPSDAIELVVVDERGQVVPRPGTH